MLKSTPLSFVSLLFVAFLTQKSFAADLVVALKPDKNPEAMSRERTELAQFLGSELKKEVSVVVPLSSAVILEGLANGTIDVAFLGSVDMLQAKDRGLATAPLAFRIDGKTTYESYVVSLKEKPFKSVEDLKGQPFAFSSRTSTSGFLIPLSGMMGRGLIPKGGQPEAFFGEKNVRFGTGYVSAIEQVLQGSAVGAAVSDYVLLKDKHLTPDQIARLKVVDKFGPVPTHVLALRKGLQDLESVTKALLKLNQRPHQKLRDQVFNGELVKINEAKHLAPTQSALSATGLRF